MNKSTLSASAMPFRDQVLSEGWVGASGIALGFYAAFLGPHRPSFVVALALGICMTFTGLTYARHVGEARAVEESWRFFFRYVLYMIVGIFVFLALGLLFGPYVTGVNYPIQF